MLDLTLKVSDEIEFHIQDKKGNSPLNSMRVMQIMIYGLPYTQDDVVCVDSRKNPVKCSLRPTNYYYNSYIQFDVDTGVEFGGDDGNKNVNIKFGA